MRLGLAQYAAFGARFRQLGNAGRDAPRLIFVEQLCRTIAASSPSRLILHPFACGGWVMFQRGRLIGDVFASIGVLLAIAGVVLLVAQYFVWLRTDVWHPINIQTVLDAMNVSTSQGLDAVLELPLSVAMFTVGLVFIWVAAEVYERS
jgi:hypothetical protein